MKNTFNFLWLLFLLLLMSSCAETQIVTECTAGHTYGFFGGLWHGIIAPFAWIGSLIDDDIAIYAMNNNGGWYDFGFILGIGGLAGGASRSNSR